MKKIHIIYGQFFDHNGENLLIGGVETYIRNLANLFNDNNYQVSIYQYSYNNFEKNESFGNIYGVVPKNISDMKSYINFKSLVRFAEKNGNTDDDILIFGADIGITDTKFKKVIAIQHGIGWDVHPFDSVNKFYKVKYFLRNCKKAIDKRKKYYLCDKIVCVDYNFINWYRTFEIDNVDKLVAIPNFTKIVPFSKRNHKGNISIIFARRFQQFRGTRIFASAIEKLLNEYPNIDVTIAGEGPDELWLKEKLSKYKQIKFDKFHPDLSIEYHQKFDIAVVPSTGSEGTSLSLLEAMSAGCAVICSDIGGLTNIILDEYNGLIVRANSDNIYSSIVKLFDDDFRNKIARNGYNTVLASFSYDKWCKSWLELIRKL